MLGVIAAYQLPEFPTWEAEGRVRTAKEWEGLEAVLLEKTTVEEAGKGWGV